MDGLVEIRGFDDQGDEYTGGWLDMEERASVTLSGRELEQGAPDKGQYRGIGDGSGGWHLELETDLEIGALSFVPAPSFLSGAGSIVVLSTTEPSSVGGNLPPHFLWAHELVDKGVKRFVSTSGPAGTDSILAYRQGHHELLSAYDWIPHENVQGVELGWGDYASPYATELIKRFSGHLDYSAFAVQGGMIDGQHAAHAYAIGYQVGCSGFERVLERMPPVDTEWKGASVFVTPSGEFGHGPVHFTLSDVLPVGEHNFVLYLGIDAPEHDAETESESRHSAKGPIFIAGETIRMLASGLHEALGLYEFFGLNCEEIGGMK